ncbi:hypothetical protein PG996_014087 [Apiospora saccharicola]|uniref:Thioester reductase (TE) domain-containing protein n=1 Tax=Apiospora saccharicola TaxID=335842 RepID=A0ABR1TK35_9PEZI
MPLFTQHGSAKRAAGSGVTGINWEKEISLDPEISRISAMTLPTPTEGLVVALTGATGFLGLELIKRLLPSDKIKAVLAIAVRNSKKLAGVSSNPKLVVYSGDLSKPSLGLRDDDIKQIFGTAHVVIHNGADVSFFKSYSKVRTTNFEATKIVLGMTLAHGHVRHLHYVSTAGFTVMLDHDLYEESLHTLPPDESFREHPKGYFLSKWASELHLERASAATGARITIHRPSIIVGEDAPNLDVIANVLHYSTKMGAVPSMSAIDGFLQLVRVEDVADSIIATILAGDDGVKKHAAAEDDEAKAGADQDSKTDGATAGLVRWYNLVGRNEDCVDVHQMDAYLSKRLDKHISVTPDAEWVAKATAIGMPSEMAGYLNGLAMWYKYTGSRKWVFHRAIQGPRI